MSAQGEPALAAESVLRRSGEIPVKEKIEVKGYDFNDGVDYARILESYKCSGFQATHFGRAVNEINQMVRSAFTLQISVFQIACDSHHYLSCFRLDTTTEYVAMLTKLAVRTSLLLNFFRILSAGMQNRTPGKGSAGRA